MSKELEALNKIQHDFGQLKGQELVSCYETIFNALKRLEAIDNANPSGALECLERIDNTLCLNNNKGKLEFGIDTEEHTDCDSVIGMTDDLEIIKQALIQAITDSSTLDEVIDENHKLKDTIRELEEKLKEYEDLKKIDEEWEE